MTTASWHAERVLKLIQPEALASPTPVDLKPLLEGLAPTLGFDVRRCDVDVMGSVEGMYECMPPTITLRSDVWEGVLRDEERPKATFAHEISHALIDGDRRVDDEEQDAWKVAGCLMMPPTIVREMAIITDTEVARTFRVSQDFAYWHLARMKREGML